MQYQTQKPTRDEVQNMTQRVIHTPMKREEDRWMDDPKYRNIMVSPTFGEPCYRCGEPAEFVLRWNTGEALFSYNESGDTWICYTPACCRQCLLVSIYQFFDERAGKQKGKEPSLIERYEGI